VEENTTQRRVMVCRVISGNEAILSHSLFLFKRREIELINPVGMLFKRFASVSFE